MRFWEFVVAAILVEMTPGPNMGYLAALALARGRSAGLAAVAGIALGLALLGSAAAIGAGTLLSAIPGAGPALRWLGITYLFWLAYDMWRGDDGFSSGDIRLSFRRGLIVNLLNPKAALFFVVLLPAFAGSSATIATLLFLTFIYVLIATAVHAGVVVGAASLRGAWTNPSRATIIRRFAAVMLVIVSFWFAWDTGR
jgi:threonine/homoserine/homoserine lactone efflux protein